MKIVSIFFFSLCLFGCISPPEFPDEPVITFTGLSKSAMNQGALKQDSVIIFFNFTDGDGDLGLPQPERTEENRDMFVIDTRTGNVLSTYHIPYIPPKGASNGIQGNGEIKLFTTCCNPGCDPEPGESDEVVFEIYVVDRSGKESNRISTSPIDLICN